MNHSNYLRPFDRLIKYILTIHTILIQLCEYYCSHALDAWIFYAMIHQVYPFCWFINEFDETLMIFDAETLSFAEKINWSVYLIRNFLCAKHILQNDRIDVIYLLENRLVRRFWFTIKTQRLFHHGRILNGRTCKKNTRLSAEVCKCPDKKTHF